MTLWEGGSQGKSPFCQVWCHHCGSGNIMAAYHVSLQDHVITTYDFMEGSPSRQVTILPSSVVINTVLLKI